MRRLLRAGRVRLVSPLVFLLLATAWTPMASAQVMEGELRIAVRDPAGRPVTAHVELVGRNPQFRAEAEADASGVARIQRVPPGVYALSVNQPGFETFEDTVEIRSAVPQTREVRLQVAAVTAEITVAEPAPPLLDPAQPNLVLQAGREQLDLALGTQLGRSAVDVVTTMPGWLLEANAVLHPRGSEYDTQYVVDGMPVYDNRSIAFAPAFENDEFEAVNVITAGIPAEYGRRLGGVIALDTLRTGPLGQNTDVRFQFGSFATHAGAVTHQIRGERNALSLGVHAGETDRYLDPPSLESFTDRGTSTGLNARFERDVTDRDRLTLYIRSNHTGFLVPNDLVQQAAGQRQDRSSGETAGQIHYLHTFSARTVGTVRGMMRDLSSRLWSNPLSTPVYVDQNRGFREGAVIGNITVEGEHHTLKLGGDIRINDVRERFLIAEPDRLTDFDVDFHGNKKSQEASAFVQDQLRWNGFAANVGFRFDRYSFLVEDNAISPRVALSYYVPRADMLLRASYDRVFQAPPLENLLLSSAAESLGVGGIQGSIPVPPSRANFFEVGLRKPFGNVLRLDASHYWRTFHNSIDDDVFFNTGISLPITFDTARIQGTEVRLEIPRWKGLSSTISYSNMHGIASSPVTGGLFISGGDAAELRDVVERFPITQDQRNTVAALLRWQPHDRVWFAVDARYGSGLPVEIEDDDDTGGQVDDDDDDDAGGDVDSDDDDSAQHDDDDDNGAPVQPIPQAILDQVDFARGRIRPNFSLNFSAGLRVWEEGGRSASLQLDIRNATDRLNVINFSGLFSGTALAPGRQVNVQLRVRF